ncbi:MAG: protein translocase subunit SecF [Pseudomonadota bacterium]
MGLRIIPSQTNIAFTKLRNVAAAISLAAMIGSIAAFFVLGLNFGIDFRGGVTVEVGPAEGQTFTDSDLTIVREAVGGLGLGDVRVQNIGGVAGAPDGIVTFIEQQPLPENPAGGETLTEDERTRAAELQQSAVAAQVQDVLRTTLGEGISFRRVDVVGPTVSGELVQAGVAALVVAIGMMLVYIWFRFEWQFSLGAILALVHDVVLTIGIFSITQLEFTLSIIAALLTIVGYSMNDTVVVFDRIRENLRKFKKKPLAEVIDLSINQTLARTLMTSITTLLALVSLFVFGGEVLRGFSFALIWGVLIGTYSSIFIASPVLLRTGVKRDWSKEGSASSEASAKGHLAP